ncbi:hypothetical protein ABEB36_000822 [Hypothenemus hampei]|uniref:Uncharacterized protein n=1 Tax=Hypothenemus hampei TaxID=57062 RepID=A0ABD1FF66_HYPHA
MDRSNAGNYPNYRKAIRKLLFGLFLDNERNKYPTETPEEIVHSNVPEQRTTFQSSGPLPSDSKNDPNYVPSTHIPLSPEDSSRTFSFSDKSIRRNFVRKVFTLLMVQLAVTVGFVALFYYEQNIKNFIQQNPILLVILAVLFFVHTMIVFCYSKVTRQSPANYISFIIFTIVEGFLVGTISGFFDTNIVLLAAGVTAVVCLSLTIFAFQTKWDFTGCGGTLLVLLVILLLFGILCSFPFFRNDILDLVYTLLGALDFSFSLVYDIQIMMGGKHRSALSPEEHIFATLNLNLDFVGLFFFISRNLKFC